MSSHAPENKFDPTPLVNAILEKTEAGKLKWEETAEEDVFIASVGGNTTLKIRRSENEVVWLDFLDENGKLIWNTMEPLLSILDLFGLARRVALKVDERVEALLETLQKL